MAYAVWNVSFGEQPTASKWNILGTNDASFADGTGIAAAAIVSSHLDANLAGGWIAAGETWTYASATTFTISGDKTTKYSAGMLVKLTQTTVKYFFITAVSYSAPNTTVTVNGAGTYTLANAAITLPFFSLGYQPQGFALGSRLSGILTATRDLTAGAGDVAYTGLGFRPSSLLCMASIDGATKWSLGISGSNSAEANMEKDFDGNVYQGTNLILHQSTGSNTATAVVKTFDADGLTLTWAKSGSPSGTLKMLFLCFQ